MKDVAGHDLGDAALALVGHRKGYGACEGLVESNAENRYRSVRLGD